MILVDDMLGRLGAVEKELRERLRVAQAHAEELEEKLLVVDPREATDPAIHSRVCYERQVAAHAWRRANTLQSKLNGIENRRYSRSLAGWMAMGFATQLFFKGAITLPTLGDVFKFLVTL